MVHAQRASGRIAWYWIVFVAFGICATHATSAIANEPTARSRHILILLGGDPAIPFIVRGKTSEPVWVLPQSKTRHCSDVGSGLPDHNSCSW